MSPRPIDSFEEFWPVYLAEHSHPTNRMLHVLGTTAGLLLLLAALATGRLVFLFLAPVAGYGPAWIGHFFVQKNIPASFRHPWWSFRADLRMARLVVAGRLRVDRAGRMS